MTAKKEASPTGLKDLESALSSTEQFIEDNQKILTIIVAAIVIIIGGYLLLKRFYLMPLNKEAQSQMYVAQQYFERDSFRLALEGDGNYLGFIDIMDEYRLTRAGKLARYYSGISYLQLGDYETAIDHLKKFKTKDVLIAPIATGAIGDAKVELGEMEEAVDWYLKAAKNYENEFTTPIYLLKAGEIFEKLGKYEQAFELYTRIEKDFPQSTEGRNIEKYITRTRLRMN